jgi:MFS family permease
MYGIVWLTCVSGSQVTDFCGSVGFDSFDIGLLTAVPFVATFSQLFAAILIERTGLRKFQFLHCATAHRLLWIPIALVPLVFKVPSGLAVVVVLTLMGCSSFLASLSSPAWTTWMADLIPRRIRGRYFAIRGIWSQAVSLGVVVILGLLLDHQWPLFNWAAGLVGAHLPQDDPTRRLSQLYLICGIFAIGAVFGATDILHFFKIREVLSPQHGGSLSPHKDSTLVSLLIDPLRDRVFRHYAGYGMTITFATSAASWFLFIFSRDKLGFSNLATNLLFLMIAPLGVMASAMMWGKLVDRWGRRPVLIVSTFGAGMSLLPWFFATRHTPHPQFVEAAVNWTSAHAGALWGNPQARWITPGQPVGAYLLAVLGCVIGGVSWSGVALAQTGIVMGFSDGSGRSKSVAANSVLTSFGGILGGLAGGALVQALQSMPEIGPFHWGSIHACFLLSMLACLGSIFWLQGMPDPGAASVRMMLQQMRANFFNAIQSRWSYPFRVFGFRSEGDDSSRRRRRRL